MKEYKHAGVTVTSEIIHIYFSELWCQSTSFNNKKNRADKTQKKVCEFRATVGPFLLMEP